MSRVEDIKELIHVCVETGYLRGQKDICPSSDRIRRKDAEALLERNGLPKIQLGRWVAAGLVQEHKGENTSPKWYSLVQIMETIIAVRYEKVV
jgi:hypothetical protein